MRGEVVDEISADKLLIDVALKALHVEDDRILNIRSPRGQCRPSILWALCRGATNNDWGGLKA